MNILVMPVGLYQTNCYMVWGEGDTCVLIDPGYQPTELLAQVQRQGKRVEAVLLTHGHFDHVGGAKGIAESTSVTRKPHCPKDLPPASCITPTAMTMAIQWKPQD